METKNISVVAQTLYCAGSVQSSRDMASSVFKQKVATDWSTRGTPHVLESLDPREIHCLCFDPPDSHAEGMADSWDDVWMADADDDSAQLDVLAPSVAQDDAWEDVFSARFQAPEEATSDSAAARGTRGRPPGIYGSSELRRRMQEVNAQPAVQPDQLALAREVRAKNVLQRQEEKRALAAAQLAHPQTGDGSWLVQHGPMRSVLDTGSSVQQPVLQAALQAHRSAVDVSDPVIERQFLATLPLSASALYSS